jgi:hypothetical protein
VPMGKACKSAWSRYFRAQTLAEFCAIRTLLILEDDEMASFRSLGAGDSRTMADVERGRGA